MSTLTVYAASSDGFIGSSPGTSPYSVAREGGGSLTADSVGTAFEVGQNVLFSLYYACFEGFVQFDTSSIDDSAVVSAATLSLYNSDDHTTTDFVMVAAAYDWGTALTVADWVAGSALSALTTVATKTVSPSAGYNALTSEAAFAAAVNITGYTRLILYSQEQANNSAPAGSEYVDWFSADMTGTTYDPKLYIEYGLVPTPKSLAFGVNAAQSLTRVANHHLAFGVRAAQGLGFVTNRALAFGVNVAVVAAGVLSAITNQALNFGVNVQLTLGTVSLYTQAIAFGVGVAHSLRNVTELPISFGVAAAHSLSRVTNLSLAFGVRAAHAIVRYYQGKGYGPLTCEVIRAGLDAEVIHE